MKRYFLLSRIFWTSVLAGVLFAHGLYIWSFVAGAIAVSLWMSLLEE